jgi:hypothetical protein
MSWRLLPPPTHVNWSGGVHQANIETESLCRDPHFCRMSKALALHWVLSERPENQSRLPWRTCMAKSMNQGRCGESFLCHNCRKGKFLSQAWPRHWCAVLRALCDAAITCPVTGGRGKTLRWPGRSMHVWWRGETLQTNLAHGAVDGLPPFLVIYVVYLKRTSCG